ncbi:hypothetical protein CFC21_032150 [Triticum aestivum]|uniref:DUF6598 domain-containing protein n=2 Tax=Triticum aestivum TaxID=4565 RepID=A0A3B6DLE5_WHEAT|nr:conglutin alpha 2-like [Triticum aestivum]KAF7018918.1 hypothetical protein CFC21_032150 [Triticum aestivum]
MSEAAEAEDKRKEEERKEDRKKRDRMRKKEKKKKQQQKEKDEEDKEKRAIMRKKEKERKKKKKQLQQQQQEEEDDAQVITSEKITEKMERKEEEEEDEEETRRQQEVRKIMAANEFLRLSSNVLARPLCYRNELAMMITEEDEQEYERAMEAERQAAMEAEEAKREAIRKAEKERERRREMIKQRKAEKEAKRKQIPQNKAPIVEKEERIVEEHADEQEAKSPAEQLKERMDNQLGLFAGRRRAWEYSSGSKPGQCGGFKDKTLLSPMQFMHCIPGIIPPRAAVIESSLQIYSFKITELSGDLKWPLNVYGVVAARDTVDHNRNLLFSRSSVMYQVLTSENDCSLCLSGPSRAIIAVDPVDFEVELRVHDGYDFRGDGINDRELVCVSNRYEVAPSGELPLAPSDEMQRLTLCSPLCRAVLSLERLSSTAQATILSVRVVGGGHPFKSGGEVFCSSSSADGSSTIHEKVVLLHSLEGIPQEDDELDLDGYLPLSRNVVSVESGGGLNVVVETYGGSSISTHVFFPCKSCNISQRTCLVCSSEVEIIVAWSRLVRDKMDLLIDGYTTQA